MAEVPAAAEGAFLCCGGCITASCSDHTMEAALVELCAPRFLRRYFDRQRLSVFWTVGQSGDGVAGVQRACRRIASDINERRSRRGLRARSVRAVAIGFPNVGKSALLNRLAGRKVYDSAPKPGVTRSLKWVRVDDGVDLLDAPGVLPMRFDDQVAAVRLCMVNNIGEASYVPSRVRG